PSNLADALVTDFLPPSYLVAMVVPSPRNSRVAPWRGPSVTCQVPASSGGIRASTLTNTTKLTAAEPRRQSSISSANRHRRLFDGLGLWTTDVSTVFGSTGLSCEWRR